MIKTRKENQEAVNRAIRIYLDETTTNANRDSLLRFTKYLVAQMYLRMQVEDCYFVDMLEDIERME